MLDTSPVAPAARLVTVDRAVERHRALDVSHDLTRPHPSAKALAVGGKWLAERALAETVAP